MHLMFNKHGLYLSVYFMLASEAFIKTVIQQIFLPPPVLHRSDGWRLTPRFCSSVERVILTKFGYYAQVCSIRKKQKTHMYHIYKTLKRIWNLIRPTRKLGIYVIIKNNSDCLVVNIGNHLYFNHNCSVSQLKFRL